MTQYLLAVYADMPAMEAMTPEELQVVFVQVDAYNAELQAAGAWVFGGGLHAPESSTVVRASAQGVSMTDGPFAEAKEQIGGFWVIEATDLDAALEWARKGSEACLGAIEVRPFQDE